MPALQIIVLPVNTPSAVAERVAEAATVLWADPSAAANRLRLAIEELLTALRVRRTQIIHGKRSLLPTRQRIAAYKAKNMRVGEILEAVKWIGNQGSHESDLTVTQVLVGAELLEYAMQTLFDDRDARIARRVKAINRLKRAEGS